MRINPTFFRFFNHLGCIIQLNATILTYQFQQAVDSLSLVDILFNKLLSLIERYLATTGTDITIVGISHFARTIDNTTHNTDFQAYQILGGSLDFFESSRLTLGNASKLTLLLLNRRLNTGDGFLQVIKRATTARTGDVLGLGEFDASSLEDGIGQIRQIEN